MLYRVALGDIIRDLRMERGLTMRDVTARGNLSMGHLSEIERGKKEASSEMLEAIAKGIGIPSYRIVIETGYYMGIESGFLTVEAAAHQLEMRN